MFIPVPNYTEVIIKYSFVFGPRLFESMRNVDVYICLYFVNLFYYVHLVMDLELLSVSHGRRDPVVVGVVTFPFSLDTLGTFCQCSLLKVKVHS